MSQECPTFINFSGWRVALLYSVSWNKIEVLPDFLCPAMNLWGSAREGSFFCCWSCWIFNLVGSVKTMWNHTALQMMEDPGQQDLILFEPFAVSYHVLSGGFCKNVLTRPCILTRLYGDIFYIPPLSIRHPFCVHLISTWGQTAFR